jgi:hypothetical protein
LFLRFGDRNGPTTDWRGEKLFDEKRFEEIEVTLLVLLRPRAATPGH